MTDLQHSNKPSRSWILPFLVLSWLHMLWLAADYLHPGSFQRADLTTLFNLAVWPFYSSLYLLPTLLLSLLAATAGYKQLARGTAMVLSTLTLLLVRTDSMIYDLYSFHINSFVMNLIFTSGGLESLGSGEESYLSFALIGLRILLLQGLCLYLCDKPTLQWNTWRSLAKLATLVLLSLFVMQAAVYGISDVSNYGPVLDGSKSWPLFQRIRFRNLAARFGFEHVHRSEFSTQLHQSRLHYPLTPVGFKPVATPPNIVMLVAESLRWDQLTPKIMPNTWALGLQGQRFTNHYSSGNGTREGLFGMFYGLYGSYWESFMTARQSPLLMDRIQQLGYQVDLRTSAKFTYPEFDKTLFAKVPTEQMHTADGALPPWQRDQHNTSELLDFLQQRDRTRPFMEFFFFESTHAPYSFPDEQALYPDYQHDVDYTELTRSGLAENITPLFNRYHNAAHWIDTQLGRIRAGLAQQGLLDNTIIIISGDHGEEFMEKGSWGHNSTFVEEQTHVPLLVLMPGKEPAVIDRLTSHLDIGTTLLQLLGASGPTKNYSLGSNLFSTETRPYIVVSDWHSIGVMTDQLKYRIPYLNSGADYWAPTDNHDQKLETGQSERLITKYRRLLLDAMVNCSLFTDRAKLVNGS